MSDIIQVNYGMLTTSFENEVMKAVQQVGINVNKEELLKALELADKLVYCKDCKWEWTQKCPPHRMGLIHDESDYCSYGIRKGADDLGDCNVCRFAGCSECDDCINGSQWVRMTKEDEE